MTQVGQIEDVLRSAIDRGDVPGVVAMAGTRDFGRRALSDTDSMSTGAGRRSAAVSGMRPPTSPSVPHPRRLY
jgi:hypothetical protein